MSKYFVFGISIFSIVFMETGALFAQTPYYYPSPVSEASAVSSNAVSPVMAPPGAYSQAPSQVASQPAIVAPRLVTSPAPLQQVQPMQQPMPQAETYPQLQIPAQQYAQQQYVQPQYAQPVVPQNYQQNYQQGATQNYQQNDPAPRIARATSQVSHQPMYQSAQQPVPQIQNAYAPQQTQQPQQQIQQFNTAAANPNYVSGPVQPAYGNSSHQPIVETSMKTPEHPLLPVLRWAQSGRPSVAQIQDYTAILRKQESNNGRLQEGSIMEIKVRHQPFSVYLKFIAPKSVDGREVLFVNGQNNGKMWAHGVGIEKVAGTISLLPDSPTAMRGNKYPLTDIGILNLVDKLVEVGEQDAKYGECNVQYYENAKLGKRVCTCVEVVHPKQYKEFRFYIARIYIDNELNVPVRYESYDWPKNPGDKPELIEAYSYDNLKINVGLTDNDFSVENKSYSF